MKNPRPRRRPPARRTGADGLPLPQRAVTASRLITVVDDLASYHGYLRRDLPIPTGAGGRRSNTREYGHPAEWASDASRRIAELLWEWQDYTAEKFGKPRPTPMINPMSGQRMRLEADVIRAAHPFLRAHADRLLTAGEPTAFAELSPPWLHGWAWLVDDEAFDELFELQRSIRARAGHSKPKVTLSIPCPNSECGMRTLERKPGVKGQDFVVCASCGYSVKESHYPFLVRVMVDAAQDEPTSHEPTSDTPTDGADA